MNLLFVHALPDNGSLMPIFLLAVVSCYFRSFAIVTVLMRKDDVYCRSSQQMSRELNLLRVEES